MKTLNPRFLEQLKHQLNFLERSCSAFDAGDENEATRISVTVRIIVHDTNRSVSLLSHLKAREIKLLSTSMDIVAHFNNHPWFAKGQLPSFFNGMGVLAFGRHRPKLTESYIKEFRDVDSWWQQSVIILDHCPYTRQSIVLEVADKDGGAHVDAKLKPEYERLITQGSLGTIVENIDGSDHVTPIADVHLCVLRQIGFELLNSPDLLEIVCKA